MSARAHRPGALLRDPVYLRVWLIGLFSGIARWLEMLVLGVFAFEVTGSPFLVALLVILRWLPLAVFGSIIGAFADRLAPQAMLRVGLAVASIVSITVCLLAVYGVVAYWHVAIATFVSGLIWCTDLPVRRRILGDAAGSGRIAAAMSLDSASSNATRMLGPLFGGLVYHWLGTAGAFGLATGLYLISVALILTIPIAAAGKVRGTRLGAVVRELREAFGFAMRDRDVLRILMVTVVFNVWGFPFVTMIPVIGDEELKLSASWVGILGALEGGGAFLGSVLIAFRRPTTNYRALYFFGVMGYLVFVFVTGWMASAVPAGATLFLTGLCAAGFSTMQSALIYSTAPPAMRSRLLGLLVISIGTGLIGFVNVGLMAEWFGGSTAIRIIAVEGVIALTLIGLGWRELRHGRPGDAD